MRIILIALIFVASSVQAQIVDTLFYNKSWQLVPRGEGEYFRIAQIDTSRLMFTGKFSDHYKNGKIIAKGQYSSSGKKNGLFMAYFRSGRPYSVGAFDDDYFTGAWQFFYADGSIMEIVKFAKGNFIVEEFTDTDRVNHLHNGTGTWYKQVPDGYGSTYQLTAHFENYRRSGTWILRQNDGLRKIKETYENGELIIGIIFDYPRVTYSSTKFLDDIFYPDYFYAVEAFNVWEGTKQDYPYISWLSTGALKSKLIPDSSRVIATDLYEKPDRPASYPGGNKAFYAKIAEVLQYPPGAQYNRIEGKVYVQFIVGTSGEIDKIQVLKGIGGGCDQEAVLAVVATGKWFPALKEGLPVKQKVVIPITFKIK